MNHSFSNYHVKETVSFIPMIHHSFSNDHVINHSFSNDHVKETVSFIPVIHHSFSNYHVINHSFSPQLRFSRPFRPILLLTRYRELRRILETLTDMLNQLLKLTGVICSFVLFFSWLGVVSWGNLSGLSF